MKTCMCVPGSLPCFELFYTTISLLINLKWDLNSNATFLSQWNSILANVEQIDNTLICQYEDNFLRITGQTTFPRLTQSLNYLVIVHIYS